MSTLVTLTIFILFILVFLQLLKNEMLKNKITNITINNSHYYYLFKKCIQEKDNTLQDNKKMKVICLNLCEYVFRRKY